MLRQSDARPRPSGALRRLRYAAAVVGGALLVVVPLAGAASPLVSSLSPPSGPVGTPVTINGTDLAGATTVTFNGTAATIGTNTATAITTTVPAGATTGPVAVTTPGGTDASSTSFTVDATPPSLAGPGNLTVEADGPGGTMVNFTVSASDGTPPVALLPGAVTCNPTSPARFPLGRSTVSCTATDAVGNVGTLSFEVVVVDRTPPSINAPDASFTAASASGIERSDPAVVSYLTRISATDLVSSVTLTTTMPATLPLGDTKIVVTARDDAGNEAQKTVTLTVLAPGKTAPAADFTPPGAVRGAAAKALDHVVLLTWAPPVDKDVAAIRIERSVVGKPGTTVVYRGLGTTFKDGGLENGVTYRYVIVVLDKAGNSSPSIVISATPKALLLAEPKSGARVTKPPLLRWAPVAPARYYNVQLYRSGVKVLSAWPTIAHLQLAPRWSYDGHAFTLKPGLYTWYVWPGLGARADARYGDLLGKSTFAVALPKKLKKQL
jgi:hypothetical protein